VESPSEWTNWAHWARTKNEGTQRSIWPVRSNRDAQRQSLRITCGFPILGTIKLKKLQGFSSGVSGGGPCLDMSETIASDAWITPPTERPRQMPAARFGLELIRAINTDAECYLA
jgi:hypothetical protein